MRHIATNKVFSLFTVLFAALVLAGCTLSMDEWTETEETRGYNEVEEITNDYYTLKYEYKKDTRSLTEGIQQYIAQVEADSIIWFTDNIPQGWLPKQGGYVVANCCELFPMGLMGRVLSIEHANGMYRVTTTEATLEDCYEEFDLDLNTNVYTAPLDTLFEEPEDEDVPETRASVQKRFRRASTRAGEADEIVIRDWTMFHDMQNGKRRTRATRASLNDVYDEDVNAKETETVDIPIIESVSGGPLEKLLSKKTNNKIKTANLTLAHTTKTSIRKTVRLKEKYEYTCTETSTGLKLIGQIGSNIEKDKVGNAKNSVVDAMKGKAALLDSKLGTYSFVPDNDKNDPEFSVEIPTPFSFGIIIRVKPVIDCNIGLYGTFETTFWLSADKVETEIKNGKKTKDKQEKKKTPSNYVQGGVLGNAAFGGGAELVLGFGKKLGGKAAGVGFFVQATLNLDFNLSCEGGWTLADGPSFIGTKDEGITLSSKMKVGGKILTAGLFGDVTLGNKEFTLWDGITFHYHPVIAYPSTDRTVDKENYLEQSMAWQFSSTGLVFSNTWALYNRPILGIFEEEADPRTSAPVEVLRSPSIPNKISSKNRLSRNTAYSFSFKNTKKKTYDIIPGVTDGSTFTWYPNYRRKLKAISVPTIEYDLNPDLDGKGSSFVYPKYGIESIVPAGVTGSYAFVIPFTLRHAAHIDEYWDDWGVEYGVRAEKATSDGVTLPAWQGEGRKSLKNTINRDGKYAMTVKFSTNGTSGNYQPIYVYGHVWYRPKKSSNRVKVYTQESWPYCYLLYKINAKDKGDVLLKREVRIENKDYDLGDLFDDFKNYSVDLKNQ